jgi:hypothetical protein
MKEVMELITRKQQEFAQLPFFQFLRDSSIDPRQRLAFTPIFAPFVMGFGELNSAVLREEPTEDPIQVIINQHSREDDSHWIWFLEDMKKLGFDASMSLSEALKFLWGKETQASRHMIYELYRYTYQASPIQKLIVIEAVEATADIFLDATAQAARELQRLTNREYRYFGDLHFAIDSGHSLYLTETKQQIESLQFTEAAQQEAFEWVERVFQIFTDYFSVIQAYAETAAIAPLKQPTSGITPYTRNSKLPQRQTIPSGSVPTGEKSTPVQSGKRLGGYLVDAGLLTSEQLKIALREQEKTDRRLGEVISDQGWVNQQTIEYLMEKVVLPDREASAETVLSLVS